jgi:MFS family permease
MLLAAGTVGILGHPFAGRFADDRGRRLVGFCFYASLPLLAFAFYTVPGWLLPFVWVPMVFSLTGGITIGRALSTELFPTSFRGTASGFLQLVDTLGAAAGLFLISALTPPDGSAVPAVRIVVWLALLAAVAVLLLPETGRRELEEISDG